MIGRHKQLLYNTHKQDNSGCAAIDYDGEYVIAGYNSANTKILKRSGTTWTDVTSSEGFNTLPYLDTVRNFWVINQLFAGERDIGRCIRYYDRFLYKWRDKKEITLTYNDKDKLTIAHKGGLTPSSVKLYKDGTLYHTFGDETVVFIGETGVYQAISDDTYYSNEGYGNNDYGNRGSVIYKSRNDLFVKEGR